MRQPESPNSYGGSMTPEKFTVHISDEILQDMRARIAATRWAPEMEDMGWRYGFDGGYLRELARTWQSEFDWREAERAINQFTHYRVTIDGFPIHFIDRKSTRLNHSHSCASR